MQSFERELDDQLYQKEYLEMEIFRVHVESFEIQDRFERLSLEFSVEFRISVELVGSNFQYFQWEVYFQWFQPILGFEKTEIFLVFEMGYQCCEFVFI